MKRRKKNPTGFTREAQIRGVRKALASPKTPPQLKKGLAKRLAHLLAGVNVNPSGEKPKVVTYDLRIGGHHVRKATRVIFPDGRKVSFSELMPKSSAIRQAEALLKQGYKENPGEGYGYLFHGAFKEKEAAARKEKSRPGSFIKRRYIRGSKRFVVMSPRKNPKGKRSKRNPGSAAELFTKFHGRGPKGVFEVHDFSDHPEVAKLGDLCELWTSFASEEVELDWTGEGYKVAGGEVEKIEWGAGEKKPIVAAEPKGKQIYIFGAVELGKIESDKELVDLGDCVLIGYQAEKKFDQFQAQIYEHVFGEDGGVPPRLMYDAVHKRLFLLGGTYKVKAEGIID